MAQDSSKPDFWEIRYQDKFIPWDAGKVPESLRRYLPVLETGARVLVPGCGSAYEARYLAGNGFDVLAIDFSPAAVELAKKNLGEFGNVVQLADFFAFDPGKPFDAIYERAFLCALPRKMWDAYARRCAELLKPGGVIAGFFFSPNLPRAHLSAPARSNLTPCWASPSRASKTVRSRTRSTYFRGKNGGRCGACARDYRNCRRSGAEGRGTRAA